MTVFSVLIGVAAFMSGLAVAISLSDKLPEWACHAAGLAAMGAIMAMTGVIA